MKYLPIWLFAFVALIRPPMAFADPETLERTGDIGRIALPAAAAGMALFFRDWEGAKQLGESLLAAALVTEGLKLAVRETSPNGDPHAFPSGHSSIAFAGASFLQRRYGWEYGVPAYLAAAFVGYTRVETDHHRIHDVLAGAAIGILANAIFTTPFHRVSVAPIAGKGSVGGMLSLPLGYE
jgi:membrane-associated phospholipid phosphatase